MFVAQNLKSGSLYSFASKEEATAACLRMNGVDPDRPAFKLYRCLGNGRKARYVGRLWREFGRDLVTDDPWDPHLR